MDHFETADAGGVSGNGGLSASGHDKGVFRIESCVRILEVKSFFANSDLKAIPPSAQEMEIRDFESCESDLLNTARSCLQEGWE